MLLESLLLVGAAAAGIIMLIMLIYFTLAAAPDRRTEPSSQGWDHYPVLDDDLLYLASSMVPYPEYAYFPALPLNIEQPAVAQSVQPTIAFPMLPLPLDRQEAIQPV